MSADLELRRVRKQYGDVVAVDDIDLYVEHGNLVSFLGPSGCGKTTTLRMIAGLTQTTAGEIFVGSEPVSRKPVHKRNVGMLFQSYALFPHMNVAANVAFGLKMRGIKGVPLDRAVDAAMDKVGLLAMRGRYPDELSGGQQQRVALARALVIEPAILLLDEPLGALDRQLRQSMQIELKALQKSLQITTVVVTHDQEEALVLSDKISVMNNGRIEQYASPSDIYQRPQTAFVARFLGTTNAFEGRIVRSDAERVLVDIGGPVIAALPNTAVEAGSKVLVAIRPQDIDLFWSGEAPGDGENSFPVLLKERLFRGNESDYLFASDAGLTFTVSQSNRVADLRRGDCTAQATINFPAAAARVITL
jgi:putative spermidine/putrescine transport system ATP-binding protein/spermidine/putrescine transport system ATP-binding protein